MLLVNLLFSSGEREANYYGKCSKIQTPFSFCFQIKLWFSGLEITKCLSELQTGKTLIRLLFQNKSDLGLPCLFRAFSQATGVRSFRTFTQYPNILPGSVFFVNHLHVNPCPVCSEHSGSVECMTWNQGSLAQASSVVLCCVLEQDILPY